MAEGPCAGRRPDRLRSLAPHEATGSPGRRRRWPRKVRSWSPCSAIRSTPSGPTSPSLPRLGWSSIRTISPASPRPPSGRRWPTGSTSRRPTRRCSPPSIRSPGRSTSAARTSSIPRSPCPSLWSTMTAPPICSSNPRRSATTSASISATEFGSTSATPSSRICARSPARLWSPIRSGRWPPSSRPSRKRAPRSSRSAIPRSSPRRSRTGPRSRATAPPRPATAPP